MCFNALNGLLPFLLKEGIGASLVDKGFNALNGLLPFLPFTGKHFKRRTK